MSNYSAWVSWSSNFFYAILAVFLWINLIVGISQYTWRIFILFPWWFFVVSCLYFTLMAAGSHNDRIFGTIAKVCKNNLKNSMFLLFCKVYAPFMIFLYWGSIYEDHEPWHSVTESYLTIVAFTLLPILVIIETIRPKNTHLARFRQINSDFMIYYSYFLVTIVYVLYISIFFITLPYHKDPIYKTLGFTLNRSEDAILSIIGWIILMCFNIVISLFTWWVKDNELFLMKVNYQSMWEKTTTPPEIYVVDPK